MTVSTNPSRTRSHRVVEWFRGERITQEVDDEDIEEGLDVPVVVTGGPSSPNGFEDVFADHLKEATIPFSISDGRSAAEPMYSVASGALVAARSEEDEASSEAGNTTADQE